MFSHEKARGGHSWACGKLVCLSPQSRSRQIPCFSSFLSSTNFPPMRVYALLLLILSLAGCSHFNPGAASRAPEPNAAFQVIADDYISGYLACRPHAGTPLALHQYTTRVT